MAKIEYEVSKKYKGVRRREGQKTWNARYSVTLSNGKIEAGELTGYATAKEAFNARTVKIAQITTLDEASIKKISFEKVFEEYYESCIDKAASTLKKYRSLYENHLKPEFGEHYISSITTADIEKFFQKLGGVVNEKKYNAQTEYSNEYLHSFRKLLNNVFKYAKKSRYIKENPTIEVSVDIYRKMGRAKEDGKYLDDAAISWLTHRLKGGNMEPSVMIAYYTGLRIGEVFGLLWSDIDFNARTISVNKQLVEYQGLWCLAKPKTTAANRKVLMPDDLFYYLEVLKRKQEISKEELGDRYVSYNKVGILYDSSNYEIASEQYPFVNVKKNGSLLTPASFKAVTVMAKKEGNLDFSFHDLRHTHITNMVNMCMPADVLKERVGHEKITTTLEFYKHRTQHDTEVEKALINKVKITDFVKYEEAMDTICDCVDQELDEYIESGKTTEDLLGGIFTSKGFISNKT